MIHITAMILYRQPTLLTYRLHDTFTILNTAQLLLFSGKSRASRCLHVQRERGKQGVPGGVVEEPLFLLCAAPAASHCDLVSLPSGTTLQRGIPGTSV